MRLVMLNNFQVPNFLACDNSHPWGEYRRSAFCVKGVTHLSLLLLVEY
jgi:hypothetical protein